MIASYPSWTRSELASGLFPREFSLSTTMTPSLGYSGVELDSAFLTALVAKGA